jgi:hypothetical protein
MVDASIPLPNMTQRELTFPCGQTATADTHRRPGDQEFRDVFCLDAPKRIKTNVSFVVSVRTSPDSLTLARL